VEVVTATPTTTIKLNRSAQSHAERLIRAGNVVKDDRDLWSEHQPTAEDENRFIERYGYIEYGKWHLGTDSMAPDDTKEHYKFPYGDFEKVHRCGVLSAEVRAGQRKYADIEAAATHLHGLIDKP
jgi:hypothetical protein